jgi:hypothetical protein
VIAPVIAASALLLFQTAKGSIEGVVTDHVTGKPVAQAQVAGTRLPDPEVVTDQAPANDTASFVQSVEIAPVMSDANGRFVIRDLNPGNYFLRASAEGYAQEDYRLLSGAVSAEVNLSSGQAVKDALFRLVPGGTISGRITGTNGEPLVNIEVTILHRRYHPDGRQTLEVSGRATTNDRGEYRIFWITPGAYYLRVASTNRPIPGVPFNGATAKNKYPRTFYPVTTDIATATTIDIPPAVELTGLDFRLTPQDTYRIRGRVVDPYSPDAIPPASVWITPRDGVPDTESSDVTINHADGTFEARDVPSGSYLMRAQLPLTGPFEPGHAPARPRTATAIVDVAGADVDGLVLTLVPPASISGRIRLEGGSLPQNFLASINLLPATNPRFGRTVGLSSGPPQTNPDGTFRIDGVLPGEYRVSVFPYFDSSEMKLYVKEVRFGAADVLSNPMVVTGPTSETLEVVFGKNPGRVGGSVRADLQQLTSRVWVVLVPDQRDRADLYQTTIPIQSGQFTFRPVPPGSYRAFAWAIVEEFLWFDPSFLTRYEAQGRPVTVTESSNVTLDLKVIPVAAAR